MALWIGGLIVIAVTAYWLLKRITANGGEQPGDAATIVGSYLDQASAFRGDDREGRPGWDSIDRMKTGPGEPGGPGL